MSNSKHRCVSFAAFLQTRPDPPSKRDWASQTLLPFVHLLARSVIFLLLLRVGPLLLLTCSR